MAPALTSTTFLLTTTPQSRLPLKSQRVKVFAKTTRDGSLFPSFRLGKSKDRSSSDEGDDPSAVGAPNSNPFRFNFGKIPDMTSLIPVVSSPSSGLSFGNQRRKDSGTVFVAGATGQAGIRIAQTLLRQGFIVRAGVPDLVAAQELARIASQYKMLYESSISQNGRLFKMLTVKIISNEESKRLNAVESGFEDAESIAKAIGNASKVVVTIGPGENGPTSEVSTSDAAQVVQAAQLAGVGHVAIVYDGNITGTSTYNVIDGISSFFNNLFSRSQPLTIPEFFQKLIETDVNYTFIKTSLTDDFSAESSYNVVVSSEGSVGTNDYKVGKTQIASLVADVFSNTQVAENKVVEVYTDPAAPLKRVDELFGAIPEDGRRKVYAEAIEKAKAEEEARVAAERAREAAEAVKELEEEVQKLSELEARATSLAEEADKKAESAATSVDSLLNKAKDFGSQLSWEKFSSQITSTVQKSTEKPKVQVATVRGQAKARSLQPKKAVIKPSKPATKPMVNTQPKQKDKSTEVRKVFGGLFTQETVYVDDD